MSAQARRPRDLSRTTAYAVTQRFLAHQIDTKDNRGAGGAEGVASYLLEIPGVFDAVSTYISDEIREIAWEEAQS